VVAAFVGEDGLARVHAHAHAQLGAFWPVVRCEGALTVGGRSRGVAGPREDEEERIALRVDLLTAVSGERLAQKALVLGQDAPIGRWATVTSYDPGWPSCQAPAMHARIEEVVGARVTRLEHVQGRGYTHAGRHRAFLADGRTVFVKSAVDDLSAGWLRTEIAVYTALRGSFLPEFHGWAEHDGLPLIVLEDLGDAHWPPPWREGDVDSVKRALADIAATAPPAGLERVPRDTLAFEWREVERDPEPFLSLGVCTRAWLDEHLPALREAAERAPFDGGELLHLDVRSDNIALRNGGAVLVDWNWACAGNALLDVVAWAPSLHLEGGPRPEDVVDGEGVAEFASALSGFFAARAGLPPPETAPRVRAGQRRQLAIALPWASRALGLPGPG